MNNRVQQRFDRSIRDAVAATKIAQAYDHSEALAYQWEANRKRAEQLVPGIAAILTTGLLKGAPLSRDDRKELQAVLKKQTEWLTPSTIS